MSYPSATAPTAAKAAAAAAAGGGVNAAKAAAVAAVAGSLADGLVLRGSDEDGGSSCGGSVVDMECVPVKSLLDSVLLAMWEECAEQGLFRWDAGDPHLGGGAWRVLRRVCTGREGVGDSVLLAWWWEGLLIVSFDEATDQSTPGFGSSDRTCCGRRGGAAKRTRFVSDAEDRSCVRIAGYSSSSCRKTLCTLHAQHVAASAFAHIAAAAAAAAGMM
jgi:hypothetical protein